MDAKGREYSRRGRPSPRAGVFEFPVLFAFIRVHSRLIPLIFPTANGRQGTRIFKEGPPITAGRCLRVSGFIRVHSPPFAVDLAHFSNREWTPRDANIQE